VPVNYIQPSVEIFNIRIDEPITTATDLILAFICFYAFVKIKKLENTGRIKWYFKYYFLTLGLGAMFGGLFGHAFLYGLSPTWKLVSWLFTMVSVALMAHALVELARPMVKPFYSRLIIRINLLIMFVAMINTLWTLGFSAVQYYTIFGMVLVVGSLSYFIHQKTGNKGVVKLMLGVGVGLVSVLIFSTEWGLGPWLNHRDISHIILSYSALTLYKGATLILEAPANLL
jgi:hypothetical protein